MTWDGTRPYATYRYNEDGSFDTAMLTLRSAMTAGEWDGVLDEAGIARLYDLPHDPQRGHYAGLDVERDGRAYRCVRGDALSPALVPDGAVLHDDGSDMYYQLCCDVNSGYEFPIAYTVYDEFTLGAVGSRADARMPVDSLDRSGEMMGDILPKDVPHVLGGEIYRDARYGAFKLA